MLRRKQNEEPIALDIILQASCNIQQNWQRVEKYTLFFLYWSDDTVQVPNYMKTAFITNFLTKPLISAQLP